MPKATINLTQDQLNVSIPQKAAECFRAGYAGHRTLLEKMLEGTEITVADHLEKIGRAWTLVSHKSKNKLLTKIFEQVRGIMKVDDPSGLGPPESTFNSYRTKIARCMIFHVDLANAHYNNRGLAVALAKAMEMKGGTLKERMARALEECKQDENWAGHLPKITLPSKSKKPLGHTPPQIAMPTPGMENSPPHLVYLFLLAIVQGGSQERLREFMRDTDDPRFKRAYRLYLEAKDMLSDFTEEEKGEQQQVSTAVAG
jgi:hypothetical protein